ncbi:MAG: hypothetical protein EBU72_01985 [Betaproteobacteria bacterium]|jgi:hypothetical protein|nr:hypothetical protein [Betaproteobacteria bacterium]
MSDVTTNALRGLVKTLSDVVAPAIPEDDPLAFQELKMTVRYLSFCRERVEHLYARARYELSFYNKLARDCSQLLGPKNHMHADGMTVLCKSADALMNQPGAAIGALREQTQELMSRLTHLLGEIEDAAVLSKVEKAIVTASAEMTAFERSWYLPLKLERFPAQVRPLKNFIPMHPN